MAKGRAFNIASINRRNKPEKRRDSYRMVAKHVLSAGNGHGKDPAARSLPDQQFLSLSRSMNSKEATRSNSKLVGQTVDTRPFSFLPRKGTGYETSLQFLNPTLVAPTLYLLYMDGKGSAPPDGYIIVK